MKIIGIYIFSVICALDIGSCKEISSIVVITADIALNGNSEGATVNFNQKDFFKTLKEDEFNSKGIISISIEKNTINLVVDDTPRILEARYSETFLVYLSKFKFRESEINKDLITMANFKFTRTEVVIRLSLDD